MSIVQTPSDPVPRGKRARTRQMLIETAAELIREKGFSNVSMEDVAARASVSRGSIYGNFRDRNDLFAAVALYRMPRIAPVPTPGATLPATLRAIGKAVAQAARANRANTVYWAAYMVHALSDEELRQRADAQGRAMRKQMVRQWTKALPPGSAAMPVETLIKVVGALTSSLIMAHSMSPDDYDEDVIVAAFEALAGAGKPAARSARGRAKRKGRSVSET